MNDSRFFAPAVTILLIGCGVFSISGNTWHVVASILCFIGLAAVLIVDQDKRLFLKGLSFIAAYLLFMAARGMIYGGATLVVEREFEMVALGALAIPMGIGLAITGIALHKRKVWALAITILIGLVSLYSAGNVVVQCLLEVGVSGLAPEMIFRVVIWVGVVAFVGYVFIYRERLHISA